MKRRTDPLALAQQLLDALGQVAPANEDEQAIDEPALLELARRDADRMRRARNR